MAKIFRELLDRIKKDTGKTDHQIAKELEFIDQRALQKFIDSKTTASKSKLMKWAEYLKFHLKMKRSEIDSAITQDGLL